MKRDSAYHEGLKTLMDDHLHLVYDMATQFPKDELYGLISRLRRSSLSVVLRIRKKEKECHETFSRDIVWLLKEVDVFI